MTDRHQITGALAEHKLTLHDHVEVPAEHDEDGNRVVPPGVRLHLQSKTGKRHVFHVEDLANADPHTVASSIAELVDTIEHLDAGHGRGTDAIAKRDQ